MNDQRDFLQSILRSLPVILFAVDKDGNFTLSEGAGLKLLGLKPGEIVAKSYKEISSTNPEVADSVEQALKGEKSFDQGADW